MQKLLGWSWQCVLQISKRGVGAHRLGWSEQDIAFLSGTHLADIVHRDVYRATISTKLVVPYFGTWPTLRLL